MDIKKKYSAVCLELDTSKEAIDDETLTALANILKRKVQLVLNIKNSSVDATAQTARETVVQEVGAFLIQELKEKDVPYGQLKNIAIMYNEGQTLVYTTGTKENKCFDGKVQYDSQDTIENITSFLQMPKEDIMGLDESSYIGENVNTARGIEVSRLLRAICLKKPDEKTAARALAETEQRLAATRDKVLRVPNYIFNNNFGVYDGIWDVFDKSGAVVIKNYEWELLDNNHPLKMLFMERNDEGHYMYSLNKDSGHILRGSNNYYYILAHKKRSEEMESESVLNWYKNNDAFLDKTSEALSHPLEYNNTDAKLLLGVMDNIRNLGVILMNSAIRSRYDDQRIYVSIKAYKDENDIKECYAVCQEVYKIMHELCFIRPIHDGITSRIQELIARIKPVYKEVMSNVVMTHNPQLYDISLRSNREIDNYIENYVAMEHAIEQLIEKNPDISKKEIYYSGVCYGGLELPFLAENILNTKYKDEYNINPSLITVSRKYKNRELDASKPLVIKGVRNTEGSYITVADDLLSTASTAQAVLEMLYENSVEVDSFMFVRGASLARKHYMLERQRVVNTRLYDEDIYGAFFENRHSKTTRTLEGNCDELLVFDKNENRVLGWLGKNRDYTRGSQVDEYMGRYESVWKKEEDVR